MGASASSLADASCGFDDAFTKQLAKLVTDRCMQRFVAPAFAAVVPLQSVASAASVHLQNGTVLPGGVPTWRVGKLPVYLLHAPSVTRIAYRKQMMIERMRTLQPPDVTVVECLDRVVVNSLTAAERQCLYVPARSRFSPLTVMSNGTLSLVMKQKAAYLDIWQRGLDAAIVLEDDAMFLRPQNVWKTLSAHKIPQDAHIFYLGSYLASDNWGVLRYEWKVNGTEGAFPVHPHICKTRGRSAEHFGGVAHIVFARGVLSLLRTIRVAADTSISALSCPGAPLQPIAGPHPCAFCMPLDTRAYGPHTWIVVPNGRFGNHSHVGGSHYRM